MQPEKGRVNTDGEMDMFCRGIASFIGHLHSFFFFLTPLFLNQPGDASSKEPTFQCRRCKRHGFNPWVGKMPWKRARQPTPILLPGESHGHRSLVGYSLWGSKESDMPEVT